jgi:hypothetical protein
MRPSRKGRDRVCYWYSVSGPSGLFLRSSAGPHIHNILTRHGVYRHSVCLDVKPLETHDQRFFFQLNPSGNSPYVTSSLISYYT